MKNIKTFENFDSNKNIEIIENCFLEWIDQGRCLGVKEVVLSGDRFYYVFFQVDSELDQDELKNFEIEMKEQLKDDIIRCESYGFKCLFKGIASAGINNRNLKWGLIFEK